MAIVVLIGTLDTKGSEYAFVRGRVEAAGCDVIMVDVGITADPDYPVEISRTEVAAAAGADIDEIAAKADRGAAVRIMAKGATAIVRRLYDEGRLHGALACGGSGGSSIAGAAMRALPVGVPKLIVSTMAAGDISPFIGTSDIAMVYSVVDIAGVNRVSAQILGNAATAMAAMATAAEHPADDVDMRPMVGATMYGTTTACVNRARAYLEDQGYEVLVFHATGPGGLAMEALVDSGHITAVLDVTTAEITCEVAGGTFTSGPDRLEAAGVLGIPQVVTFGGTDMIAFSPPSEVPASWSERNLYSHNPSVTLARTSADEAARIGSMIAGKLNAATGPVSVFIPLGGTSSYDLPGAIFHDPAADAAMFAAVREVLDPSIELIEMDTDVNDPAFAEAMARRLHEHYQEWAAGR
ncbi:Tm-1-like ATP-binding domain-containing protein [bacterium]|nr:Tm-1-like ATP-binding domain-containing protein [bacterium]